MKPEYEQILNTAAHSFITKKVIRASRPLLTQAWHYHPEIELCFTATSQGKRFMGNNISNYAEGDLVLIGSNLPHGFTTSKKTEQYVFQFKMDFLGETFFNTKELRQILSMLKQANRGIQFFGNTQERASFLIEEVLTNRGFNKLIKLLELLHYLSLSKERKIICPETYSININIKQLGRVKSVLKYIENNFQKNINISTASKHINLTEAAFYKFIKKHTNKKFTAILNEYRIDHATKLLTNSDFTVAEICYKSG